MSKPTHDAACILCSCTDSLPCINSTGETCMWALLDRRHGEGLCNYCYNALYEMREQIFEYVRRKGVRKPAGVKSHEVMPSAKRKKEK
jgi:hypothetical protein